MDKIKPLQRTPFAAADFFGEFMRLDKYLKVSRIIKRRTIANEACDAGKIEVNGKIQRASYDVKIGDRITVNMGTASRSYEVVEVSEHALKEDAAKMYKIL